MNVGIYQGAAALAAYEKWQETISQNIASGSVPGFKKSEIEFTGIEGSQSQLGRAGSATTMPRATERMSFLQGEMRRTGGDTDFAVQGPGFFQVQRENGELAYTRDGEFHLSADKTLTTKQGLPIMGDGGPITLKPDGGPITVSEDGTISQGANAVGKIVLYDFTAPEKLHRAGSGLLSPEKGQQPQAVEKPAIVSGFLENSNVQPLKEMVDLITVSRAYEASQKVISMFDDNTNKAIQTLGNPRG